MPTFGAGLKKIRSERQWSQASLATHLGISRSHLCNLEHERFLPSTALAKRVADTFGMESEELIAAVRSTRYRTVRKPLTAHRRAIHRGYPYVHPVAPQARLDVLCREATFYRLGRELLARVSAQERSPAFWNAVRLFLGGQNGAEQVTSLHLLTIGDLEDLHPHRVCYLRPVVDEPGRDFLAIVLEDRGTLVTFHSQVGVLTESGKILRLDFLVSISNAGRPWFVDLEIDGPSHERHQVRDAERGALLGHPVLRVSLRELDQTNFLEWLLRRVHEQYRNL